MTIFIRLHACVDVYEFLRKLFLVYLVMNTHLTHFMSDLI
jgi:hypothetical protein